MILAICVMKQTTYKGSLLRRSEEYTASQENIRRTVPAKHSNGKAK